MPLGQLDILSVPVGYDLHITRRKHWSDEGDDISSDEWLAYVRGDPELRLRPEAGPYFAEWSSPEQDDGRWLDWREGHVYSKNPDSALIDKMVAVAEQLRATVQGDDGELYRGSSEEPQEREPIISDRLARWFGRFRPRRTLGMAGAAIPFAVGDRVCDPWGNQHTVIEIDREAQHGMGLIRTRRDDGSVLSFALVAHGLTPIPEADEP